MKCPNPEHNYAPHEENAKYCHICGRPLVDGDVPSNGEQPKPHTGPTRPNENGTSHDEGERQQSGTLFPFVRDYLFGFVDANGHEVIAPRFKRALNFSEGLAAIEEDGRWGFINTNGEIVIAPQYYMASSFSESRAAVYNGYWGYIDLSGRLVIPCQYNEVRDFSEGLAAVKKNGMWGYVDAYGDRIIQPNFLEAYQFHDELARVMPSNGNRKYGFIDHRGHFVIKPCFHYARDFSEGCTLVTKGQPAYYCYIDRQGQEMFSCIWDVAGGFHEGLACVLIGKEYGYVGTSGNVAIEPRYDDAEDFSEGLAAVKYGDRWGYIDRDGKLIISPRFRDAGPFQNGRAIVITDVGEELIDKEGKSFFSGVRSLSRHKDKDTLNISNLYNSRKHKNNKDSNKNRFIHHALIALLILFAIVAEYFFYESEDQGTWFSVPVLSNICFYLFRCIVMIGVPFINKRDFVREYALSLIPLTVINVAAFHFTNGWSLAVLIPTLLISIFIIRLVEDQQRYKDV